LRPSILSSCFVTVVFCTILLAGCTSSAPLNPDTGPQTASPANLLISEAAVQPNFSGEFIEVYNPADLPVSLDDVYIADYPAYYGVVNGVSAGGYDFNMRFPEGAVIEAGGVIVIAVYTAGDFFDTYGFYPDFDTEASDENAPAMEGSFGMMPNLNDVAEMVVLYSWGGSGDLVTDIDYIGYGEPMELDQMDKTGVTIDGPDADSDTSGYLADTAITSQDLMVAPGDGQSMKRTDFTEGAETKTGGNGMTGHDETSEDYNNTFTVSDSPSPGEL